MSAITVKEGLHWVGIQDHDLRVFDVIMETEFGTSYNSYILKTPQYTVLFETVKRKWMPKFLENVREICDPSEIDYIVIDHTEPDHVGSLADLLDLAPKAKVVASAVALNFLENICNREIPGIPVGDDDEIKLDTCTLKFLSVPFLHWPDSIYTYIPEMETLVTCDSFGSHYADDRVCNDLIEGKFVPAYKYYFDMIMGPFKNHVRYALDKIEDLKIDTICPGHGPVLRTDLDFYLNLYKEWSKEDVPEDRVKPKVVCAYVSAYGYTEDIAKEIAKGIHENIDADVALYDMVFADAEMVQKELGSADGVLGGTPTVNGDALPPVTNLFMNMNGVLHGGKVAGAFGSYGWSGEGADMIMARQQILRMNTVEPPLKVVFKPSPADFARARAYGKKFAKRLAEEWVKLGTGSDGKTYWKCTVCGEVFEGALPPLTCPVCGVGQEAFIEDFPEIVNYAKDCDLKVAIIGSGAAAMATAESIRKRNKTAEISIFTRENDKPYYRPLLTKDMELKNSENFFLKSDAFYETNKIGLNLGVTTTEIDKESQTITFEDGSNYQYDKLVIATGAACFMPPIKGIQSNGVHALREKSDLDKMVAQLETIQAKKETVKVVIMGGGLLGLETACALTAKGCLVTVLEASPNILPRQMDKDGVHLLREAIEASSVKVKAGVFVDEIYGNEGVQGVITACGQQFECDMVIVSAGVRSNIQLAQAAKLDTTRGIKVNAQMQTSDENIYSVGDCAEYKGVVAGLWDPAISQGRIAGANIAGDVSDYQPRVLGATLHAFNVKLFSIGDLGFNDELEYQQVSNIDNISKTYKKLYFVEGKLVGGILFGDLTLTNPLISGVTKNFDQEECQDNKLL